MLTLAITDACSDTVKVQNSLSFSDPECTEHSSKVSTPRSGRGRSKNTQEWTSTAEAWPPAVFCCLLLAFSLDEDILMCHFLF